MTRIAPLAALVLSLAVPTAAQAQDETIVLAGGCFWGMEGTFEHLKGVKSVVSGYAGGSAATANYTAVSSELTNHAEAVRVVFDPARISLAQILDVYFTVAHDPTQLNRQTPDVGTSYRSAIFPQTPAQRAIAQETIRRLNAAGPYKGRVVTRIESGAFFPAERYHQDFMRRNPTHPYILAWDVPRIQRLKARFPALYRNW